MAEKVKVGIIGFGTVGAGVANTLLKNGDIIASRTGVTVELTRIADLDITTDRGVPVPPSLLTTDADRLIDEVDVVVELIGGKTVAKKMILKALSKGKHVVTANKALLAEFGGEIFETAAKNGVDVWYEASVGGGIPVIKALREGLAANRIERIYGILNGTCNYILTRMEAEGADFAPILADAQKLGYAEQEPSLDVDGFDTAHKAAILASLAYGEWFGMAPIHVEGIRDVSQLDLSYADELGYRIKLLAIIKQINGDVQLRVHPTLIPKSALLGNISGVFNGVLITGDTVGDTLFYGRGAGRNATASAVAADLVDVARNIVSGSVGRVPAFRGGRLYRALCPISDIVSRYYLRLAVRDESGVLAAITNVLSHYDISLSSVVQRETVNPDGSVPLLILTHATREAGIEQAIRDIEKLPSVIGSVKRFRIEDI
ncbi:MAG: homoserine dehydrogenase [Victivallaceae bacterium]|nr:homoserine dehydrogenase [Victivallaceae bacterium]